MQNSYPQRRGRQGPPVKIVPLPGQVSFRVICHTSSIGGVIGSSGSIVSQLRRETSSRIHCEEPVRGSDHRVILIVGSGSVERRLSLRGGEVCEVSCAQEAMIRVFERVWEVQAERERGNANACDGEEEEAYCGLLADSAQIGFVVGKGGKNIVRMRAESGAKIWILPPPPCGRTTDQLIQITGGTSAVKGALVAVSGYLQAFPSMDKEPAPMNTPTERPSRGASPDPPEKLFPNLGSLLPPTLVSNTNFSSVAADGDSILDSNGKQKVIFRMLCSNVAAGAIIGKKAGIVRALQYQTGASIMFDSPETDYRERVVTISALENLESGYSPAQNALVLVFARSVESDIEKGFPSGLSEGTGVTFRLLVSTDLVSCLKNKEGSVLSEIVELTGADVEILVEELSLGYSPENVVQITGDYKSVQNAILQVTNRLRDNLLLPEKLNEIKSCHKEVRGIASSQVLPPTTPTLDNEHRPNLTQRMHPGHSENTSGPQPVVLLPQKTAGNRHTVAIQGVNHGSTTFGGSFDLERSLDFLLPRDMLNEVGDTSPYKGGNETTFPSSLQTLHSPLVSDQATALTRAMGNIGLFDDADCPSESQLFGTERRHGRANAGGKGDLELESQSKSIMVKSTSVEIVVHADAFGSIYGKNGCNLARLKEISGAKVEVHDPRPGETEGIVLISGTPDQTLVAQSLLQAFIQANHLST